MKLFKNLLLLCVLSLGFTAVQAQLAHINTEDLFSVMPETKKMQEEVQKTAQAYDADYKSQVSALEVKLKRYDQEAALQTGAENQKRAIEVEELKSKLQVFASNAQQVLQKKQYDLYKPIEEKAVNAIKYVADEKGFDYVLDSSKGKGLIVYKGEDLLAAVKARLGI